MTRHDDGPIYVASVSGGKDSVAASLWLDDQGIAHRRIFFDTGWEHPELYAHLDYLDGVLGPIERVIPRIPALPEHVLPEIAAIEALVGVSPSAFVRWIAHKGMFPSRTRRFCTHELKLKPFCRWVDTLDSDVINVVGIRAAESAARSRLPEREAMPEAEHIEVWRPLIRWTEAQVVDIHQRHGVRPCPLYLRGARRVGCWPCIQSSKGELALLRVDARRVDAIRLLEALVGRLAKTRYEARGDVLICPPALYQAPIRTAAGTRPCWPIDDILTWARTEHGGRTLSLDAAWGHDAGCGRWGMCEHEAEQIGGVR